MKKKFIDQYIQLLLNDQFKFDDFSGWWVNLKKQFGISKKQMEKEIFEILHEEKKDFRMVKRQKFGSQS